MKAGWRTATIGETCHLMTGGTPSKSSKEYFAGDIRWLVSGDIHKGEIFDCDGRISEAGMRSSNAKLLPVNSVMIALNGQGKTRGTVALLRTRATCNQSLVSIYPKQPESLLPEFVFANLHGRYDEIRRMTGDSGNDRRGLNMSLISSISMPIPPPTEQRRIIRILDEALAATATAKANAEKNLQNARALFESQLAVMFTRRHWKHRMLGALCSTASGGTPLSSKREYYEGGTIPWLLSGEVGQGEITAATNFITASGLENSSAKLFPVNTVLVAMYGATAGQVGLLRFAATTNQAICGILPSEAFVPEFLFYSFLFRKRELVGRATGNAQPNISQVKIRSTPVPVVNLKEQRDVVVALDELSANIKRLTRTLGNKLAALEELRKAVLTQAFSGHL
jgi:type I restriction enzyme S subunit